MGELRMQKLYRTEELRILETRARAGLPAGTLMQRAGAAAAQAIHAIRREPTLGVALPAPINDDRNPAGVRPASILVLCGPGDNGGDGFECAAALRQRGHACLCWAPLASASVDAQAARRRWEDQQGVTVAQLPIDGHYDLVVDALLGIGAARPLDGALLAALRWIRERGVPVVALDLPSGINADTGEWIGGIAGAPALLTVTFLGDKPGLHLRDGLGAAGRIRLESLGTQADAPACGSLNGTAGFAPLLARRAPDANKGSYGAVMVAGGAVGMVGAALLAGRAALRMGAGKVFVDCLGAPDLRVDPLQPELMLKAGRSPAADEVLVVGCGMGSDAAARARLAQWLAHDGPALFDADALNAVAIEPALRARLQARTRPTVITPHPGEAARLLQIATAAVQGDRVASALRLAREFNAIAVLKGAGSVIADPSGAYVINPTGGPALASAGTGDVLAGITGALLAQCVDPLVAVRAAVWLHGRAVDLHGSDVGLVASEVAALAARAWEQARAQSA
jgi:hydroxyethylthiazole kinase-like uncharacterized protein yjeF